MSEEFKLPPATTLEEANKQRDDWKNNARIFALNSDYYKSILLKIATLLNVEPFTSELETDSLMLHSPIPEAVNHIICQFKESNAKRTELLLQMYETLGIHPSYSHNIKRNLDGLRTTARNSGFNTICEHVVARTIEQISDVENILTNGLNDCNIPMESINPNNKASIENMVKLKILCRSVNGQIQIGYMREENGTEHNFTENGGDTAFYINVEVDKNLLIVNHPEIKGRTERTY